MSLHEDIAAKEATPIEDDGVTVRTAIPEDMDDVMRLALLGHQENGLGRPDIEAIIQDVWCAVNMIEGICGVIGPVGGPLEGMSVLRVGRMRYSLDPLIEEKIIFVDPRFRSAKGGRAVKLARFSVNVSDALSIPLSIGILSSIRTEAKVRMYTRVLGPPSGAYWLHGIKTGH